MSVIQPPAAFFFFQTSSPEPTIERFHTPNMTPTQAHRTHHDHLWAFYSSLTRLEEERDSKFPPYHRVWSVRQFFDINEGFRQDAQKLVQSIPKSTYSDPQIQELVSIRLEAAQKRGGDHYRNRRFAYERVLVRRLY